jgi:hypothetical protein
MFNANRSTFELAMNSPSHRFDSGSDESQSMEVLFALMESLYCVMEELAYPVPRYVSA